MEKLLSIVVPVYKVEKYISKCLDSLIVSDDVMEKMEVIVVNDGTPDQSALIAKTYEKRYPDVIHVIDKENGGHGSAWNVGVELASGKYLRFLDSDDWLTNLEEFISKLEKLDVDMIFTDVAVNFEKNDLDKVISGFNGTMNPNIVCRVDEYDWIRTNRVYSGHNVTNFHLCTYRTTILKKYHPVFFEKIMYDDEILYILPLCESKTFVYLPIVLYNYLMGREGQSWDMKVMLRNVDHKLRMRKYEVEFYKAHKPSGELVNRKLLWNLNSRHKDSFGLLSLLPCKEAVPKMKNVSEWIEANFPEFEGGKRYAIYKVNPYLFWVLYRYVRPKWKSFLGIVKSYSGKNM